MPAGRPTKYKSEYTELALNYCLLGATDQDLANFLNVTDTTIDTWKLKHPEFLGALRQGKHEADAKVAQSLYKRAIGYTAKPETKEEKDAEGKVIRVTETIKSVAGDTTAAIFWLKNRQKDNWRDRHDINHEGSIGLVDLTDDELTRKIKQLEQAREQSAKT